MAVAAYPEFFNDVFGPVMQPGSSSHFAGPCRLGLLAGRLLGEAPAQVRVLLDKRGSFAGTFGMMAEDRALVGGVLGFEPDDARLFRAFEAAEEAGAEVSFEFTELTESRHPNAAKFILTGRGGRTVELVGNSTGGGMVETVTVAGFPLRTIGDAYVLLVHDALGRIGDERLAALVPALPELVDSREVRVEGRGVLHAFMLAAEPDPAAVAALLPAGLPGVELALLTPLLPVVSRLDRQPQLFDTMTGWREIAEARGVPLWEVAVQYEIGASGWTRDRILERMRMLAGLMRRQTRAVYEENLSVPTSPFKPDFAGRWAAHAGSAGAVTDGVTAQTIKWAYGAGSGIPGVVTVPGPMGGGGGYIYAALSAVQDARGLGDDDLLRGLFVAAAIGAISYTRSAPTGEVTGCSGEAGTCGAMAAAAIVEMVDGTPEQAENAASLALQSFTGVPCDPMPGGSCQPCRGRILATTCMAPVFADLALAGHEAVLPLHEAIDVLDAVGRGLPPELLCTSAGGACAAPAAQRCRADFEQWFAASKPEERPPASLI
ncbi:MAG: L-serine ammonia-lyase, iron-sulfur-dependent, subunit alpha [Thermoleophilia bacterium]